MANFLYEKYGLGTCSSIVKHHIKIRKLVPGFSDKDTEIRMDIAPHTGVHGHARWTLATLKHDDLSLIHI